MLTKTDIKALRNADCLCIHLPNNGIRAIKRKPYNSTDPFATDIEHLINADVVLETSRGRAELEAGKVKAFAMVNLYHNQNHTASLILRTLREGDEITFSFYPDAHTNGYVAAAGLHADALYLHVSRNGKRIAKWCIAESICPTNSARMINGVPNSRDYDQSAIDARKVA